MVGGDRRRYVPLGIAPVSSSLSRGGRSPRLEAAPRPVMETLMDYADAYALLLSTVEYSWCACGVRAVGEGLSFCVLCEAAHANAHRESPRSTP